MCTVSWMLSDRNYKLYFNRDEQRSRPRADAPKVKSLNGIEVISPHDSTGGGSWIAVNQFGLTSFLLNNYGAVISDMRSGRFRSRGELPMLMASESGVENANETLRKLDFIQFRPFYLGVVKPPDGLWIVSWNGVELKEISPEIPMLTTSSFRTSEVEEYRRSRYIEICKEGGGKCTADEAMSFHVEHSHPDPAFNPLMSREDAETQCVSVIEVDSGLVSFNYYERLSGPNPLAPAEVCEIERKSEV